jgi:hypothetical protein
MTKTTATAHITCRPGFNVRATLGIKPLARGASKHDRLVRERTLAATAYQLAAHLELLAGDSDTSCAISVDAHDGAVTIELAAPTTDFQAFFLMTDACGKLQMPWTGPRG